MKALMILMPEGFRDEELRIPKERLEGSGVDVTVAGLRQGVVVDDNVVTADGPQSAGMFADEILRLLTVK